MIPAAEHTAERRGKDLVLRAERLALGDVLTLTQRRLGHARQAYSAAPVARLPNSDRIDALVHSSYAFSLEDVREQAER